MACRSSLHLKPSAEAPPFRAGRKRAATKPPLKRLCDTLCMDLTLTLKLHPTQAQAAALRETMERVNAACNAIAETACRAHTTNKVRLQQLVYADIRATFGLSAQMTVRAISKVAAASKRDKTVCPTFRPYGAVTYDPCILSWKGEDHVSLLTVRGRQIIPIMVDDYHRPRLHSLRGQADLMTRDGQFYLAVIVHAPEPAPMSPDDWLGVDLGIVNIAADSDGTLYSGGRVNGLRRRHTKLRRRLQQKGTASAKRLLKQRFAAHENHRIVKQLVTTAQDTRRGMALEDLTGSAAGSRFDGRSAVANTVGRLPRCGSSSSTRQPWRVFPWR